MKTLILLITLELAVGCCWGQSSLAAPSRVKSKVSQAPPVRIERDARTGLVRVVWTGLGVLEAATRPGGPFTVVRQARRATRSDEVNQIVVRGIGPSMVFRLRPVEARATKDYAGTIISRNVVGFINVDLPPGLSLIVRQLEDGPDYQTVSAQFPSNIPDGAQVFKYSDETGYEVSTFDGSRGVWSNPSLRLPVGEGFYFQNPPGKSCSITFVGEVLEGELNNPLPAGYSMKGTLVPQAGSLTEVHGLPGEPGDKVMLLVNDGQGGSSFVTSEFSESANAWVPDPVVGIAQGFWIWKQHAQDWIRTFYVR